MKKREIEELISIRRAIHALLRSTSLFQERFVITGRLFILIEAAKRRKNRKREERRNGN